MKRSLSVLATVTAMVILGGCYYDPGYTYVRGGGGDAYYGSQAQVVYPGGGYYGPDYYDYYGYYGCCYGPALGLGFYFDSFGNRHYYNRGGYGRGGYGRGGYGGRSGFGGGRGGSWGGRSSSHGGGGGRSGGRGP